MRGCGMGRGETVSCYACFEAGIFAELKYFQGDRPEMRCHFDPHDAIAINSPMDTSKDKNPPLPQ